SVALSMDVRYRGAARFDDTKIRRVFYNLVRNAREAMHGKGEFRVEVAKEDEHLVFEFIDNGPGIPKELEGRLFEPFSTAGKKGGTGLGLAMVRKIAEEHGGTVRCDSRPGRTTFTMSIPA